MLDTITAARALFGLSIGFHIIFAVIGVGLRLFLLIIELLASRTGDEMYKQMAVRWARIFAMLFALGAVTGTIMSLELGLLFPGWMEFSGSIIGFIFTVEGVAFFIEAIFLGLYVYGRGRIFPGAHWILTIPLFVGSLASAILIISINGWMNQPSGFEVSGGQAVNIDHLAVFFNKAMPHEVVHGVLSAYVATGFMLAGIYAVAMLKGDRSRYNRTALMLGMDIVAVAIPLQVVSGDFSSRFLAENQPEKFAAMEASSRPSEEHRSAWAVSLIPRTRLHAMRWRSRNSPAF